MATGVGLHIAENGCAAAIVRANGKSHFVLREPVLHMSDEGDAALGGEAPPGHNHTITGFVAAVGDPAGITVDDGAAYRAEDLFATALFCLIDLSAEYLSGPTEFFATHPARWPEQQVRALREALDYLGLRSVALIGENELPDVPADDSADRARACAESAARAALATVLDTPAGTTPPDPITTENATLDTIVMPAVPDPATQVQAYSAVQSAVEPALTASTPAGSETTPPATVGTAAGIPTATVEAPATTRSAAAEHRSGRALPTAIAAALLGLLVGAIGVATVLRGTTNTDQATEGVPSPSSTAVPAPPPAPPIAPEPPAPVAPEPTAIPEITVEPEPTTTPESPEPSVTESSSSETSPETSPETSTTVTPTGRPLEPSTSDSPPTTDVTSTTPKPAETTISPLDYIPIPLPVPAIELPGTGSQDETKPRFVP
ncbi:hypothetical protein [Nocardia paucivorans]|uniref:hypothetical protein n=1 Tax=Nocardia paucivorans TaxID=114259 RepID=UPI0002EE8178|nr:hypothetical protein [Nocardia paucivorans]